MIYNRPPLNCQKCQFRFFTDQGLERHLLGSHGLVTSSMQEAANKGKDAGRCPVCGRVSLFVNKINFTFKVRISNWIFANETFSIAISDVSMEITESRVSRAQYDA